MRQALITGAALAVLACSSCAKVPFGEALIVVDTDVSVPTFVSRLQVDLYTLDGSWYESRGISTLERGDWPLSFSLYTDERAEKRVRMRLRAFPEGALRDYRGEQPASPPPFVEPTIAHSLEELCADPPELPPFVELTQRRGAEPITEHVVGSCPFATESGSVAAKVQITEAGSYRFEVVRATPDGANSSPPGSTTLFLRSACAVVSSELGCDNAIDLAGGNFLSRLVLTLDPGTYYLITGSGARQSPADVTLRWAPAAQWTDAQPTPTVVPPAPPLPRLMVDGIDVTPSTEPQPNLSIDRLVDLSVDYGARHTVSVILSGECYGTAADLVNDITCVDAAGTRVPVALAPVSATSGIGKVGDSRSGTWPAEREQPCTTAPRSNPRPGLYEEDVCIPGGAFLLGSEELTGVGPLSAVPRQMVVVDPFYLDRFEVTVGRYRQALRDGFVPPDLGVSVNDSPLRAVTGGGGCTFNGDVDGPTEDRESYPLSCVSWRAARALCTFWGGDLPSHVQWEYAATVAGRSGVKSRYSWGNDPPDCSRAVYGNQLFGGSCGAQGVVPVDAAPWVMSDVTPLGVVGLAGNVSEWVIDSFRPYSDSCWWQRPLRGVGCIEEEPPLRSIRGDDWLSPVDGLLLAAPIGEAPEYALASYGFRCARPGIAP